MIIETSFYIGIIDQNNNLVVEYKYDGYGNIISIIDTTTNNIGEKNPYRYRSYYFDTETSWYYLNSRYYDSSIGRFITMDEVEYLGVTGTIFSCNLYSYCEGNPVVYEDDDGNAKELLINQLKSRLFSRSSGEDLEDVFYVNAPKIPVASTTITVQAELVVIPVVKKAVQTVIKTTIKIIKVVEAFVDGVCGTVKNFFKKLNTPGGGAGGMEDVYPNLDPGTFVNTGINVMTSLGGKFKKIFDDGNESWDIFDYPY